MTSESQQGKAFFISWEVLDVLGIAFYQISESGKMSNNAEIKPTIIILFVLEVEALLHHLGTDRQPALRQLERLSFSVSQHCLALFWN